MRKEKTMKKTMGMMVVLLVGVALLAVSARAETIVTFQQGALIPTEAGGNGSDTYSGTRDMHLRQYPTYGDVYNTGGTIYLVTGQYADDGEDDNARPLIDFSYGTLSTYMQANNLKIQSVTLKMYLHKFEGNSSSTGQTVDVFKGTSSFNEGDGSGGAGRDGDPATTGESCFAYQSYNTVYWAGGGSHNSADWGAALDTGIVLSSTGTWYELDVTGAYAEDGSDLTDAHLGFVMLARVDDANPYQDNTDGGKQACFMSAQGGSNQPILEITLVPEPATLSLLAAGTVLGIVRRKRR